jgi:hypothetical protein
MRRPDSIEAIAQALRPALRYGASPYRLRNCNELLALQCVQLRARDTNDTDALAYAAEGVLLDALTALGDGPYGRAAAHLFGVSPDARGRLLKDRRRLAAYELDLLPTTFRKQYEEPLLHDIAAEVARPLAA